MALNLDIDDCWEEFRKFCRDPYVGSEPYDPEGPEATPDDTAELWDLFVEAVNEDPYGSRGLRQSDFL